MSQRLPVLLVTSNGVGMGHLTRQLTVALSAPDTLDPVLMSLSGALPTVRTAVAAGRLPELAGVRTEYCPSRKSGWLPKGGPARRLRELHPAYGWEPYFADRLRALVAETGARLVLFDGVVPYAGLRAAREQLAGTPFVWMRRGMWRAGVGDEWLAHAGIFDLVVEPGDFAAAGDRGPTAARDDATRVAPISIADAIERHDRAQARAALGLDPDRPALLLTPGTGALEDVASPVRVALDVLRRSAPDWQVAVTSPALARHGIGSHGEDVHLLTDTYPLARSLAAFDGAVSAAGYNSVHELLGARIPTVLVPGQSLGTDDQPGRAATLAAAGACLSVDPGDAEGMRAAVTRLLDPAADRLRGVVLRPVFAAGDEEGDGLFEARAGAGQGVGQVEHLLIGPVRHRQPHVGIKDRDRLLDQVQPRLGQFGAAVVRDHARLASIPRGRAEA